VHSLGPFGVGSTTVFTAGLPVSAVWATSFDDVGSQSAAAFLSVAWVVNADGSDAHEIVANEATRNAFARWFSGMQWSPSGDRIAIGLGGDAGIYTFAPDGSDFTKVITGGVLPFWSPDGSQIAYTIPPRRSLLDPQPGDPPAGLAIADADRSNVRAFGFARSGPWHPGESLEDNESPTTESAETPAES
jgi:Tol biopolymer transport system component